MEKDIFPGRWYVVSLHNHSHSLTVLEINRLRLASSWVHSRSESARVLIIFAEFKSIMKFSTVFAVACAIVPAFSAAVPADEAAVEERNYDDKSLKILTGAVQKVTAATKVVYADVRTTVWISYLNRHFCNERQILINTSQALNITTDAFDPFFQLALDSITLNDTITNQTLIAKKAQPLCDREAKILGKTVAALVSEVQKVSKQLIKIEPLAVSAGVNQIAQGLLSDTAANADRFSNVLIQKTPTEKALGQKYKKQVDAALQAAITAYGSS